MEDIVTAACAGWLCPEVIEAILTDPEGTGFQFSLEAPTSPRNGQLYVFDSTVVKHFKLDGIDWTELSVDAYWLQTASSYSMMRGGLSASRFHLIEFISSDGNPGKCKK